MSGFWRLACWTVFTTARTVDEEEEEVVGSAPRREVSSHATRRPAVSLSRRTRSSSVRRLRIPSQASRLPMTLPR